MTHQPRKRFGQHFLVDPAVLAAIVTAIDPRPGQRLVEIGPGLGALTQALLERIASIDAIEIDRDLVARLRQRFGERLSLHEGDALEFDFGALARGAELRLIGNLPYNISSPLLIRLLNYLPSIADQHFMLQREVVERIVASPGGRDYGRLTVMLQAHYDVEQLFDVPPRAFDPPPRVDSALLRMIPLSRPLCDDVRSLESVLSVAFGQRRKMLRNTLLPWLQDRLADQGGLQSRLSPTARAEEIPVDVYCELAQRIARREARTL